MKEPIYFNEIHRVAVEDYMTLLTSFTEELASESQFSQYLETVDSIIDYHNGYEGDVESWLMILPLHLTVMASGLFVGIENDENRAAVRGYKLILDNHLAALAETIGTIKEIKND